MKVKDCINFNKSYLKDQKFLIYALSQGSVKEN